MRNVDPFIFYKDPIDIYKTQPNINIVEKQYNCRQCNQNLASNDPASQYQRQKLIQNTVRIPSSLYTMNLASLSGYQKPSSTYQLVNQAGTPYVAPPSVNWNQMSDRAKPANQVVKTGSGSTYHGSSTRHSIVRNRPGAMSPGGVGVDIKHNSYERRLNKLKGKAVLRRGIIPTAYGSPIPFNRSEPIYGGKVIKTSIINGCNCPDLNETQDKIIYGPILNAIQDQLLSIKYTFSLGDFVWAKKYATDSTYYKAEIIDIVNNLYTIRFTDDNTIITVNSNKLLIYFDCNCSYIPSIQEEILRYSKSVEDIDSLGNANIAFACYLASQAIQE
jgi:hypothetical protein